MRWVKNGEPPMCTKFVEAKNTTTPESDRGTIHNVSNAAVQKMISEARERGFVTYDQLNQILPPEKVASERIEIVMSILSDMGIVVTDGDEVEAQNAANGETQSLTGRHRRGRLLSHRLRQGHSTEQTIR